MRLSRLFTKTSKTVPSDEVAKNAQLLIKAGFIHKEMAGVYSYLPLGLKVLNKIAQIVREEMNHIDGQEVLMPALQIKERYQSTGRWDDAVVDDWFKTKLVNGSELGLGFSHEENISPIAKNFINSYKDLPFAAYQIQTKFRNEARSKSGLMRGREFLMKDMYSFAISQEQHEDYYNKVSKAYETIFKRLGIGDQTVIVMASGGSFSKYSHEFQTFSEAGEDIVFKTADGQYYNREIVSCKVAQSNKKESFVEFKEVLAKGVIGVEALIKHLGISIEKSTKTVLYITDEGKFIAATVRSDYDINEIKLCEAVGCKSVKLASDKQIEETTGAKSGYSGLVGLPECIKSYVDDSLEGLCNFESGTNKTDYHAINVNFERDVKLPEQFYDIKVAKPGDLDPKTNKAMEFKKAIEVGNIFSLGTKFSEPFNIEVADDKGQQKTLIMGCYGIGIGRVMGTIAEVLSDEKGLVWPQIIAPARVYLASLGQDAKVLKAADDLYEQLCDAGIEVIYDDRDVRAGEKFTDADLLGIPYRVVVSEKTLSENKYELKKRTEKSADVVNNKDLLAKITNRM